MAANPFSIDIGNPLAGFGQMAQAWGQKNQREGQAQAQTQSREAAFDLLSQSQQAEDPVQRKALFMQAYQADPDMIKGYIDTMKTQREGEQVGTKQGGMTEYQAESLKLKKEDHALKALERKAKAGLVNEKLERDIAEKKRLISEKKKAIVEQDVKAIEKTTDLLDTINIMETHPGLESAVGFQSVFPSFPGSDVSSFEAHLEKYQSQQFMDGIAQMKGMGALSESEGRKISAAASALDLNLSDEEFRKEMGIIKTGLEVAKSNMMAKLPPMVRSKIIADDMKKKIANLPEQNKAGWELLIDANGNAAYVSPTGEFEEIK